jgi:hypothetical protein
VRFLLFLALLALPTVAQAQKMTGPAPNGDPPVVAQRIILEKFKPEDCPFVAKAARFGDGSIAARCSNGEWFHVLWFKPLGYMAMRSPPMDELLK